MSRKYFFLGDVSKAAATTQAMRDGLAAQLGIDAKTQELAASFARRKGMAVSPTMENGHPAPAMHKGESYQVVQEHTNSRGERVTEIVRKNESGMWETKRVVEGQADRHTFVVSDVRGRYRA